MYVIDEPKASEVLPRADLDGAWKEILAKYFKDFVELCWPEVFNKIDWTRPYTLLEQELQSVSKKEEIGKRISDKLIQVYLKDGQNVWALIHLEVEGSNQKNFAERIYIYRYRIFDRHKKDIATLAILVDDKQDWRPNLYEKEFWGSKLRLEYPILKILDFKQHKKMLLESRNPFAFVILAQLAALETAKDKYSRLISKFELTKWLYLHSWDKQKILNLFRFLEEVLVLPKDLKLQYHSQVNELEKELCVSYMTSTEKMWLHQGESTLLLRLLKGKFGTLSEHYCEKIAKADEETLLNWGLRVLSSNKIEEVFEEKTFR